MSLAQPPLHGVPMLTDVVVDWPDDPAPPATAAPLTEEQLIERVLDELQRRIDPVLDHRLHQILGPLLARAADGLVRDTRHQLASTLRDVVAHAVAQQLARHRDG